MCNIYECESDISALITTILSHVSEEAGEGRLSIYVRAGFSMKLFLVGGGSGGRGQLTCRRTNHNEVIHSYEQIFLFSHFQLECLIYC